MSTAVAAVRVHPEKYKKDFNAVVTFLIQHIDKRAPTLSVKVASVTQTSHVQWQIPELVMALSKKRLS